MDMEHGAEEEEEDGSNYDAFSRAVDVASAEDKVVDAKAAFQEYMRHSA